MFWNKRAVRASASIRDKKFTQGLFFCHLCIEKITKTLPVKKTKEIPPKPHDIFYPANKAKIVLPEERQSIIQILMRYQLEGKYPEYYPKAPSGENTLIYFRKTQKFIQMVQRDVINIVKQYIQNLQKDGILIKFAFLYGSFARGEASENSDIDVLPVADIFDTDDDLILSKP